MISLLFLGALCGFIFYPVGMRWVATQLLRNREVTIIQDSFQTVSKLDFIQTEPFKLNNTRLQTGD